MNVSDIDKQKDFVQIQICNNSCWVIGELARKTPEKLKPFLAEILQTLSELLNTDILNLLSKKNE